MGFIEDLGEGITGQGQARAARNAAAIQSDAANAAAQQVADYEGQITGQFQPYSQFGQGLMPMAQQAYEQNQALYGAGAGDAVMNSPMFQALLGQANEEIMGRQAALGRVGTSGSQEMLQDAALRTGYGVLQQERQANLANIGSLMGGVGMGQQAAGSIANALQNSLTQQTGYTTDAAAARAAGLVGAANAKAQGAGNVLGLGTTLLTGGFSNPFGGMAPAVGNTGASLIGGNFGQAFGTWLSPTQDLQGTPGNYWGR